MRKPPPLPSESNPGPPPVPVTEPPSLPVSEPPSLPRNDNTEPVQATPVRPGIRWPTLLFGALPATYFALPAGAGILLGLFARWGSGPGSYIFLGGLFGWASMISLWASVRSRETVGRFTAIGLLLGVVGAIIYAGTYWFASRPSDRITWFHPILLVGPVWISLIHLTRFRQAIKSGAEIPRVRVHAAPPSEASTRRVQVGLTTMMCVHVYATILFGAMLLSGSAGLGGLAIIVVAFPFALGIATFSAWAFYRHRPVRILAAIVFFAPVILMVLLQSSVKIFGQPNVITCCERAVPWAPLAFILILPRTMDRIIPGFLRRRGACVTYIVIQSIFLVLWGIVLAFVRPATIENTAGLIVLITWHTGISLAAGSAGLIFSYVSLFRPREERFVILSIVHLILSILLLGMGAAVVYGVVLLIGLSGWG